VSLEEKSQDYTFMKVSVMMYFLFCLKVKDFDSMVYRSGDEIFAVIW